MTINLGIIGTGSAIRRLHWPVLQKMPDSFRIVAVANRTKATAVEFAREVGGAKVYDHYQALLDDPEVDAILTAVPVQLSAQVLIDAIRADKHVLGEKPIASSSSEARQVLDACKKTSKIIAIAENFRYREDVLKAREIIESGEIGDAYCFHMTTRYDVATKFRRPWFEKGTWRHDPTYPGGMITDTSIHIISSLRDVLGDVSEVYAQVQRTSDTTKGPDCFLAQFTMSNGAIGNYLACYSAKVAKENVLDFAVLGKSGSLQLTEGQVVWWRATDEQEYLYRPEGYDRGYTNQWRNFYRAILGEETLLSTPEKAYQDLLVVDAALYSAVRGEKVKLNCSAKTFTAWK